MTHDDWKDSLPEPWLSRQRKWDRGALIHRAHEEAGLSYRQIGKVLNRSTDRVCQIHHGFLRQLRYHGPISPAEKFCQIGPFVLPLLPYIRKDPLLCPTSPTPTLPGLLPLIPAFRLVHSPLPTAPSAIRGWKSAGVPRRVPPTPRRPPTTLMDLMESQSPMPPLLNEFQDQLQSVHLTARLIDLKAIEAGHLMQTFVRFVASQEQIGEKEANILILLSMYCRGAHVIDEHLFRFRQPA